MPDGRDMGQRRTHLAIVHASYLKKILTGSKTIESRFSKIPCPPYNAIAVGDEILFKPPGGPVVASAQAAAVLFFDNLNTEAIKRIVEQYGDSLQLEPVFLEARRDARYCTLIFLESVTTTTSMRIQKRDRRGWVVLPRPTTQLTFSELQSDPKDPQVALEEDQRTLPARNRSQAKRVHSLCSEPVPLADHLRAVELLRTNSWRDHWWIEDLDSGAIGNTQRETPDSLRDVVRTRLKQSISKVYNFGGARRPYRDGYQTPYEGNIVYYAQHALALCC